MAFDAGAVTGSIQLDYSQAVKSLTAVEQQTKLTMGRMSATTERAGKASAAAIQGVAVASAGAASSIGQLGPMMGMLVTRWLGPLALVTAAVMGLQRALRGLFGLLNRGIGAIDQLKVSSAGMAASLMAIYPEATFEKALDAAEQLAVKVEGLDVIFSGSGEELRLMLDSMLKMGAGANVMKLLTDETGKTGEAFVALAEALKAATAGQNFQIQVFQEIRALMTGQRAALSALIRQLQLVDPEIVKHVAEWKEQGVLFERLQPLLKNYVEASKTVAGTLSAIRSSWETIVNRILRAALIPAYDSIVALQQKMNSLLYDANGVLTEQGTTILVLIRSLWESIRISAEATAAAMKAILGDSTGMLPIVSQIAANILTWQLALGLIVDTIASMGEMLGRFIEAGVLGINAFFDASHGRFELAKAEMEEARRIVKEGWRDLTTMPAWAVEAGMRIDALRRGQLGLATAGEVPDLGAPPDKTAEEAAAKAHKAAMDALSISRDTLKTKIDLALTDKERVQYETELANLLHRYANDARLTQVERNKLLQEELRLRRDMSKEEFAFAERDFQFRRDTALSFEAQRTAMEGLVELYAKAAASENLNQTERQAAAKQQFDSEKALLDLERDHADALLALETARAQTWAQQKTQIEKTISLREAEAAQLDQTSNRYLALQTEILRLKQDIWEGDEAHLQTLYEINIAEARTFAQQRALIEAELAQAKADAARPIGEDGWTESQQAAARQRAVQFQQALNGLLDESITLQRNYTASLRLSTEEQIALIDQRIADQQAIVDLAGAEGRSWQEVQNALIAITGLTRERTDTLLRQQLALIEQQIAVERTGYDEKIRVLQAALDAEKDVTKQIELRAAIRATATDAIQAQIAKLQESGRWESMTLQQQADLLAEQLALWGEIAGVALPDIQRMLTEMQVELLKLEFSLRGFLLSMGGQLKSDFESFFKGLMDGTKSFRDLWASVLSDIQTWMARIIAEWAWEKTVGKLLAPSGGGEKAADTNLLASTAMGLAAKLNNAAADTMGLAALAMQRAADTMFAASGSGDGGDESGILGMIAGLFGSVGGGGGGGGTEALVGGWGDTDPSTMMASVNGIVTRPTLARAGESESMPLSQLAAAGAGAPTTVNLTIQAIDTQTGMDFLLKNRGAISSALQQSMRENNPVGRRL